MNILTRTATLKDLPTLLEFEQEVINFERQFDSTLKSKNTYYYNLAQLINEAHIHLRIATYKDEIIGCGYARIETSKVYLRHKKHAYLGFMYVKPNYRGIGVNKLIINGLKKWVLSKNLTELRLDVYFENQNAIKAYHKAGFKKHMIEMRMKLLKD